MAQPTPLRATHYVSGETIRPGDRVTVDGHAGVVEFVLGAPNPPPAGGRDIAWFHRRYGHGFMVLVDDVGPVFKEQSDDDLTFVGRGDA